MSDIRSFTVQPSHDDAALAAFAAAAMYQATAFDSEAELAKSRKSEARLRAATDLAGLAIYSWDPVTGALEWDERLRAMWGLPPDAAVTMEVYEAGIHPHDLPAVQRAIAACLDPLGEGQYNIE